MDYFKINYNKLENIPEIKYYKIIILIVLLFIFLILLASKVEIFEKFESYGIYSNNTLTVKINSKLSDNLKKSEYIIFNDLKFELNILEYGNYEIIDNDVYQEIKIYVDGNFYDNEVGIIEFYYNKENALRFIWNLFK